MFDIAFSELMVIGIVALIVIGPERLPRVARTIGHLLGRAQRYVNDVKTDINREIQLDELKKLQTQVVDSARAMETSVRDEFDKVRDTVATPTLAAVAELEATAREAGRIPDSVSEPIAPELSTSEIVMPSATGVTATQPSATDGTKA